MKQDFYNPNTAFRSRLSFAPLVKKWKAILASGEHSVSKAYASLLKHFLEKENLHDTIDDYNLIKEHSELIEQVTESIFPPTLAKDQMNAIAVPFSNTVIYASSAFRSAFMEANTNYLLPFDPQVAENIAKAKTDLAYKLILKNFYQIDLAGGYSFICAYPEPAQNIYNYFELTWDPQFVLVSSSFDLPALPDDFILNCHHTQDLVRFGELRTKLPLEQFIFDGIILLSINEVTDREAVDHIRNILEEESTLENAEKFQLFKDQLSYLLKVQEIEIGVSSFSSNKPDGISVPQLSGILGNHFTTTAEWTTVIKELKAKLQQHSNIIISKRDKQENMLSRFINSSPWQFMLCAALYKNEKIIGCLEIYLYKEVKNLHIMIMKLRSVIPYLQSALQERENRFQQKVERLVKEYFTAIHHSVEWKFNQVAIDYLSQLQQKQEPQMNAILFDQVYALYAAVDIRSSSVERNKAVQKDLLQQLHWIKKLLHQAATYCSFPIMDEINGEVEEKILKVEGLLVSFDDETLYDFLRKDVSELFYHLMDMAPDLKEEILSYFAALENTSGIFGENQKKFEDSVNSINHYLGGFLDREQKDAQVIYPHYFERFESDGVDFNMYIGQAIVPQKEFNILYLKNLRLWQLKVMATAARYLHKMQPRLTLPLQTTQLILAYSQPISVSFRSTEKKFDVDGTHSARFEVIKKRIDKVYIKNSNERLTRPGTIAIVHFNDKEAEEYLGYINFLKKEKLLEGEAEKLELEDLQGVTGLKALRISIRHEQESQGKASKGVTKGIKNK